MIHPDAFGSGLFAKGRSQKENLKAVLADVFGHGNETCTLPGQPEAIAAAATARAGGLLFTAAEVGEFNALAKECGRPVWKLESLAVTE